MGHRALIAYERPDSTYNLHYTHWGALHLRLKHALTEQTPFGGESPSDHLRSMQARLLAVTNDTAIDEVIPDCSMPNEQIDVEPWAVGCTLEEIITEHLDYLHHEAFYVVDSDFEVTAYRTHWFGLQYDCRAVDHGPTVGNGALRTIRWYDGEPVGDGFAQGEFRALKDVTGDLIDRGVFTHGEALEYLTQKLAAWVDDQHELIIRTPNLVTE